MSGSLAPEDRERIAALFEQAADLPFDKRAAFVVLECEGSPALRDELERLLATLESDDVLERLKAGADPLAGTRTGTQIGPYKLLEELGTGGMGEVYAAEQIGPVSRRVALKVIKPGMDSAEVIARFGAERQALARMTHPNVAQVYDGGSTDDGRPFFVMELVEGEPINTHCDRHKLSTGARLKLFLGVCSGVQHAHQKGIIHRDLKPSNLLIAMRDGHAIPKVIDFGVARATTGRLAHRTLHTMLGQIVGTPEYMSPEQADPSSADVDTRSDVYSLGVLLYELLSGLLPFERESDTDHSLSELRRVIREQHPATPSGRLRRQFKAAKTVSTLHGTDWRALIRQLSGDLDWICMKALEKDPARRYASVAELADDVRRHLACQPVLAGPPGMSYRVRKFARRHRIGVGVGLAVAAAVCASAFAVGSARLDAASKGDQLRKLEDRRLLAELEQEADSTLWPPLPTAGRIQAMEAWVARAQALLTNRKDHESELFKLRQRALPREEPGSDDVRTWLFAEYDDQLLHDWLAELVTGLEMLESELLRAGTGNEITPVGDHGWSVPRRLSYARSMETSYRAGGGYAAAWAEALPLIHDDYPGLDLTLQMGLLPIGRDEVSKLWEFSHLMSGTPAERDEQGNLILTKETGLVLVLIPGGTFAMGAQNEDASADNFDSECLPALEGPVQPDVPVAAFFLSKYEMTRNQWSRFVQGRKTKGVPRGMVTWNECDSVSRRLGLTIPSEEQWEYAARGGQRFTWWKGKGGNRLQVPANLLDVSGVVRTPPWERLAESAPWDDGFPGLAPIGSFAPNPFGLYNVLGNLSEWTSSPPGPLGQERKTHRGRPRYLCRGGNFQSPPSTARASFRGYSNVADFAIPALGFRPARPIDSGL